MTRAFARFLHELQQRAPQKKDGFDPSVIASLAGDERDEARRLLQQALIDGDDTAVGALLALDGERAFDTLTPLLSTGDEYVRIRIVEALAANASRRADIVAPIGALLASKQSAIRVQALALTEQLADVAARIALLTRYLASETDALYRSGAARSLLQAAGRSPDDAEVPSFANLLEALRGDDVVARAQALSKVGV